MPIQLRASYAFFTGDATSNAEGVEIYQPSEAAAYGTSGGWLMGEPVARNELPWVPIPNAPNPERVEALWL